MSEQEEKPKVLSDSEVAALLKCSVRTLQRLRKKGKIGYVMVTAKLKGTRPDQVDAFIHRQSVPPSGGSKSAAHRQA